MPQVKAKVVAKVKKKSWYPLVAPKVFNNAHLGDIYLTEANQALGRSFWYALSELTQNMRDQAVYLKFMIRNVTGSNLNTELMGYRLTPTSIKKMVRRNADRSDDSFMVLTSDNKKIRIKTLMLTAYNTKHSISTKLKEVMIKSVTEEIKKINFGNLLDKLIAHRLQSDMKKSLAKVYPLKAFEIKFMGFEKEKLKGEEVPSLVVEETTPEVPAEAPAEEKKEEAVPVEEKKEAVEEKPKRVRKKKTEEKAEENLPAE